MCRHISDTCVMAERCLVSISPCLSDPLALLCRDCTTFKDVHYTMDGSGGSTFNMNVSFRWRRKECRESALLYQWDPHVKVLVKGQDNHTITERTLHCRVTEVCCTRFIVLSVPNFRYIYTVHLLID